MAEPEYAGQKTVTIENEHLRLVAVPSLGAITELFDKDTGHEQLLARPAEIAMGMPCLGWTDEEGDACPRGGRWNLLSPLMEGLEVGDEISEVFWEGDSVWYAMQVLAAFEHGGRSRLAVAVHPERNLDYFGPMGITRALSGDIGDRENLRRILFRLIEFGYERTFERSNVMVDAFSD